MLRCSLAEHQRRQAAVNQEDAEKLETAFRAWVMTLTPVCLLEWMARTRVDGDSSAQLAIHEIKEIEKVG